MIELGLPHVVGFQESFVLIHPATVWLAQTVCDSYTTLALDDPANVLCRSASTRIASAVTATGACVSVCRAQPPTRVIVSSSTSRIRTSYSRVVTSIDRLHG